MTRERTLAKLHVTIPNSLFKTIEANKDMHDIDEIITNLLYDHYDIE